MERDFRTATRTRREPVAAFDLDAGMLLANVEVDGAPERAFASVMTSEVERWWRMPGVYELEAWTVDLRARGSWRVGVRLRDGTRLDEWGEVCHVDAPRTVTLTRRFGANPLLGERETLLTYRFAPTEHGTLITVHESGFLGRPDAARGNAENWERVLSWLADYLRIG